jgi:hypothetical protein
MDLKDLSTGVKDLFLLNFVDKNVRKARLEKCNNCKFDGLTELGFCKFCDCHAKTKTSLINSTCPKGEW